MWTIKVSRNHYYSLAVLHNELHLNQTTVKLLIFKISFQIESSPKKK